MFIIANPFPAVHDKWGLLGHLMMYFENNMDPDQTAPLGSSLTRFQTVCFHAKSSLVYIRILVAELQL